MSGIGMANHQLNHKQPPGWPRRFAITATAGVVSLVVNVIFIVTKFTEGAWVVVALIPVMALAFMRLHRAYNIAQSSLRTGVPQAAEAAEVIDCPDRRLTRAVLELAAQTVAVGQTDNVNTTIIPFRGRGTPGPRTPRLRHPRKPEACTAPSVAPAGVVPVAQITPRQQAKVAGRVRSIQVQPWSGVPTLELTIIDTAGNTLTAVFLGRRRIAGIQPGTRLSVEGMVGSRAGRLSMLNPIYEILAGAPTA